MPWVKNDSVIGNEICTQFQNTVDDQLNPQNAYNTSPFINDNSTTSQTITFVTTDSLVREESNTKSLTATSSSSLSVNIASLTPNIAQVVDNVITVYTAGTAILVATQSGNGTYDPATPVYCYFKVYIKSDLNKSMTYVENPLYIQATTAKNNVNSFNISIDDIRYTQYYGGSYGYDTGFIGSVLLGSISALDTNNSHITDFSDTPVSVVFRIPNANVSNQFSVFKRNGSELIDPQPTGYPVPLSYITNNEWSCDMTSLSDIVIIDQNPPAGKAGGDPYIMSIKKVKTLLPNKWKKVILFDNDEVTITANCDFLDEEILKGLHYINKSKREYMSIDKNVHKWTTDITYIKTIEVEKKISADKELEGSSKKLIIDTIKGYILEDNSPFIYEKIAGTTGLYSMTHYGFYPIVNLKRYVIHFNDGYIIVSIDNFWDDINYIELYLHKDDNLENLRGELIEHDESNMVEEFNESTELLK
jgi:hypothetical protein